MTFQKLIVAIAVFTSATVVLLTHANAAPTQDSCVAGANIAMEVTKLRDASMPFDMATNLLVKSGVPHQFALGLVAWVYSNPETNGFDIGSQLYQKCMKQVGEEL